MTTSHLPASSDLPMNEPRCESHVYCTDAFNSLAMISTILFSNPSRRSFENGRLSGSPHTRSSRAGPDAQVEMDDRTTKTTARLTARDMLPDERVIFFLPLGMVQRTRLIFHQPLA